MLGRRQGERRQNIHELCFHRRSVSLHVCMAAWLLLFVLSSIRTSPTNLDALLPWSQGNYNSPTRYLRKKSAGERTQVCVGLLKARSLHNLEDANANRRLQGKLSTRPFLTVYWLWSNRVCFKTRSHTYLRIRAHNFFTEDGTIRTTKE